MNYQGFLWDVLKCSLSSFGGPEAHYGIFSSILVDQKKYITADELQELIGLYALVPGPSSTQTITGIGYHLGGIKLAILTFLVWAFPAIVTMSLVGVLLTQLSDVTLLATLTAYLPVIAIAFIASAATTLTLRTVKSMRSSLLFIAVFGLALFYVPYSMWVVPALLVISGCIWMVITPVEQQQKAPIQVSWSPLILLLILIATNEILRATTDTTLVTLLTSMFRYGYTIIGGGQIVIPLMIQDIVQSQQALSLADFLSGYAIDQAIPGPLFSFAAFVTSNSISTPFAFLYGIIGGLLIFVPGILLVFFIHPLWHQLRLYPRVKTFLFGVSLAASALVTMTFVTTAFAYAWNGMDVTIAGFSLAALLTKKIPAPVVIGAGLLIGFLTQFIA